MSSCGAGARLGELLVGTPSLTAVKLLLSVVADEELGILLLAVKCAFLYRAMRSNVYIELPQKDP